MRYISAILAIALTACASQPQSGDNSQSTDVRASRYSSMQEAEKNAAADDIVCTYEKRVGSHMKEAVCMTRSQREEQREASERELDRQRRSNRGSSGSERGL